MTTIEDDKRRGICRPCTCGKQDVSLGSVTRSGWRSAWPTRPTGLGRVLKALYREAGVSNASCHSGRRTLITRLAERGIDLKAIAEIAGHSSIRTTAVYVEANPARDGNTLDRQRRVRSLDRSTEGLARTSRG